MQSRNKQSGKLTYQSFPDPSQPCHTTAETLKPTTEAIEEFGTACSRHNLYLRHDDQQPNPIRITIWSDVGTNNFLLANTRQKPFVEGTVSAVVSFGGHDTAAQESLTAIKDALSKAAILSSEIVYAGRSPGLNKPASILALVNHLLNTKTSELSQAEDSDYASPEWYPPDDWHQRGAVPSTITTDPAVVSDVLTAVAEDYIAGKRYEAFAQADTGSALSDRSSDYQADPGESSRQLLKALGGPDALPHTYSFIDSVMSSAWATKEEAV